MDLLCLNQGAVLPKDFEKTIMSLHTEYGREKQRLTKLYHDITISRDTHNRIIEQLFEIMDDIYQKNEKLRRKSPRLSQQQFHNKHAKKFQDREKKRDSHVTGSTDEDSLMISKYGIRQHRGSHSVRASSKKSFNLQMQDLDSIVESIPLFREDSRNKIDLRLTHELSKDMLSFLQTEPTNVQGLTLQRWRELGPIDIEELIQHDPTVIPEGEIQIKKFANGVYRGQLDLNGREHGLARLEFNSNGEGDNNIYEGFYVNGLQNGMGRCIWSDGSYYVGEWINGNKKGLGKEVKTVSMRGSPRSSNESRVQYHRRNSTIDHVHR